MNTSAIFNRMPGLGVISNKKRSAQIFNLMSKHYENDYNFVPHTYILPAESA